MCDVIERYTERFGVPAQSA